MKINRRNYTSWSRRIFFMFCFLKYGVFLNPINGQIHYLFYKKKCKGKKLQILRHGKTMAVERFEFMSDTSVNSQLSKNGVKEIQSLSRYIERDLPDIVIVSTIYRTMETFFELQKGLAVKLPVCFSDEMRGINNTVWEGMKFENLDEKNLLVFLRRECEHNMFFKTENGDSWADVLYRCAKLLKFINRNYSDKKILLISQGSIYQGLKILLHIEKKPWENYSAIKMFNIKQTSVGDSVKYGCIYDLY